MAIFESKLSAEDKKFIMEMAIKIDRVASEVDKLKNVPQVQKDTFFVEKIDNLHVYPNK